VAVGRRRHEIRRAYAQIDNAALHRTLRKTFAHVDGEIIAANVTAIDGDALRLQGSRLKRSARVIIDATGAGGPWLQRSAPPAGRTPVLQSAFGLVADLDGMPDPCSATFMDWSGPNEATPTFLYALDYGSGRWLVEETSLASRAGLDDVELETRLRARLDRMGVDIRSEVRRELVRFRMDVPMPVVPQQVVAIGAAAGLVHPATGYSVATSLALADPIANVIATGGDAASVWNLLWPADRVKARALEAYGLERVLTMDASSVQVFFDVFFALPIRDQATYLSGRATSAELAAVMWRMFNKSPLRLRSKLATGNPLSLAKSLLR
jgi:lycopene beta-cyclase